MYVPQFSEKNILITVLIIMVKNIQINEITDQFLQKCQGSEGQEDWITVTG